MEDVKVGVRVFWLLVKVGGVGCTRAILCGVEANFAFIVWVKGQ